MDNCWSEIRSHLPSKTEKQIKSKWQILRGGYRQRRKDVHAPSGSGATPVRKWVYFDALRFLEPFLCERSTTSNTPSVADYVEQDNVEVDEQEVDENSDDVGSNSSAGSTAFEQRRSRNKRQSDDVERSLCNYLTNKTAEKKINTSVRSFLESLEEDMLQLSPQNLRSFKIEVLSLLNDKLSS